MSFSIQAGKVEDFTASINTGWFTVNFENTFEEETVPLVFAQIQTRNGKDTPGIRLKNITNNGFEVRMDEVISSGTTSANLGELGLVQSDNEHPHAETLAWMAVDLG